jgi:hypothetical protein
MSEALGIVEHGDHPRDHAEYGDIGSGRHWQWYGGLLRILQHKQAQDLFRFDGIDHGLRVRGHRQSGDLHHLWRVVIDRQRYPIIPGKIRRLLAIRTAEEVKREALVRIAHCRRLRPAFPVFGVPVKQARIEYPSIRAWHCLSGLVVSC